MNTTHLRITSAIAALMLLGFLILGAGSLASAAAGGPTVVLTSTSATTTSASSIPVTATFSEDVTGFEEGDIDVSNGTIDDFTVGTSTGTSTDIFTFNVLPTASGTVTVMVPADVAFASSTATSTGNQESNTLTFTSTMGTTTGTTTLAITGIDAPDTTAIANGNFADGWQWIIHFNVPTDETNFQLRFNDFTTVSGASSTIPAASNIRYYSTQSSNATNAGSAIVASNNDYGGVLTLTGDASGSAGRQIDLVVEVAVPSGTPTGSYSTLFGARSSATSTATTTNP